MRVRVNKVSAGYDLFWSSVIISYSSNLIWNSVELIIFIFCNFYLEPAWSFDSQISRIITPYKKIYSIAPIRRKITGFINPQSKKHPPSFNALFLSFQFCPLSYPSFIFFQIYPFLPFPFSYFSLRLHRPPAHPGELYLLKYIPLKNYEFRSRRLGLITAIVLLFSNWFFILSLSAVLYQVQWKFRAVPAK
jgi:hypothetical protein